MNKYLLRSVSLLLIAALAAQSALAGGMPSLPAESPTRQASPINSLFVVEAFQIRSRLSPHPDSFTDVVSALLSREISRRDYILVAEKLAQKPLAEDPAAREGRRAFRGLQDVRPAANWFPDNPYTIAIESSVMLIVISASCVFIPHFLTGQLPGTPTSFLDIVAFCIGALITTVAMPIAHRWTSAQYSWPKIRELFIPFGIFSLHFLPILAAMICANEWDVPLRMLLVFASPASSWLSYRAYVHYEETRRFPRGTALFLWSAIILIFTILFVSPFSDFLGSPSSPQEKIDRVERSGDGPQYRNVQLASAWERPAAAGRPSKDLTTVLTAANRQDWLPSILGLASQIKETAEEGDAVKLVAPLFKSLTALARLRMTLLDDTHEDRVSAAAVILAHFPEDQLRPMIGSVLLLYEKSANKSEFSSQSDNFREAIHEMSKTQTGLRILYARLAEYAPQYDSRRRLMTVILSDIGSSPLLETTPVDEAAAKAAVQIFRKTLLGRNDFEVDDVIRIISHGPAEIAIRALVQAKETLEKLGSLLGSLPEIKGRLELIDQELERLHYVPIRPGTKIARDGEYKIDSFFSSTRWPLERHPKASGGILSAA